MVDVHIHMVLDGADWKQAIARHGEAPREAWIRSVLADYRDKGYTYLRDGGDRWGVGKAARSLAPEYGITYRTPLAPLVMEGHYGSFIGRVYADTRQYACLVRQTRLSGGDFIKIMVSGLMDFHRAGVLTEEGLPPALIRELVHIAHEEGMAVMAHANGAATILAAADAGAESVEHGAYADGEALSAMASCGTVWVPTLSTVGNLLGKGRYPDREVRAILDNGLKNIAQYRGLIAPGTDAGAWAVPHGAMTEEGWLRQAGIGEDRLTPGICAIREKFRVQP